MRKVNEITKDLRFEHDLFYVPVRDYTMDWVSINKERQDQKRIDTLENIISFYRHIEKEEKGKGVRQFIEGNKESYNIKQETTDKIIEAITDFNAPYEIVLTN